MYRLLISFLLFLSFANVFAQGTKIKATALYEMRLVEMSLMDDVPPLLDGFYKLELESSAFKKRGHYVIRVAIYGDTLKTKMVNPESSEDGKLLVWIAYWIDEIRNDERLVDNFTDRFLSEAIARTGRGNGAALNVNRFLEEENLSKFIGHKGNFFVEKPLSSVEWKSLREKRKISSLGVLTK